MTRELRTLVAVTAALAVGWLSGCGSPAVVPKSFGTYNAKDQSFGCDSPEGWQVSDETEIMYQIDATPGSRLRFASPGQTWSPML